MAPPKKGTAAWKKFIKRQKKKRRQIALQKNIKKFLPLAAKQLKASQKFQQKLQSEVDQLKSELSDRDRDVKYLNKEINALCAKQKRDEWLLEEVRKTVACIP